jgi:phosphate transport system ATP-binding protein
MTTPLLFVENLCLRYGSKPALEGVTLAIPRGRITALIGPSGCGKTSFLQCLNRLTDLIPGCVVSGRVRVGDLDVFGPRTDVLTLRRRVGMIFQKPNPFPFSIRRNLEFPLREHGVRDRHRLDEVIETALRDVGLWDEVKDRMKSPAPALSGGQQQRLCMARALALGPEVLLLDEPCSALDPISSGVIEDLIARLRERITLLIVTHNIAQARRIADEVALFWSLEGAGRLIESGPAREFFDDPKHPLTADYLTGVRG